MPGLEDETVQSGGERKRERKSVQCIPENSAINKEQSAETSISYSPLRWYLVVILLVPWLLESTAVSGLMSLS